MTKLAAELCGYVAFRLRVSSAMSARRRTRCSATIPMSRRQSACEEPVFALAVMVRYGAWPV